jgi:MFS family permease
LLLVFSTTIEGYILLKFIGGITRIASFLVFSLIGYIIEKKKNKGIVFAILIAGASFGWAIGSLLSGFSTTLTKNL